MLSINNSYERINSNEYCIKKGWQVDSKQGNYFKEFEDDDMPENEYDIPEIDETDRD